MYYDTENAYGITFQMAIGYLIWMSRISMRTHVTAITDPWVGNGCDMSPNITNGCNKIHFDYKLLL
jgi:hypothetical protein